MEAPGISSDHVPARRGGTTLRQNRIGREVAAVVLLPVNSPTGLPGRRHEAPCGIHIHTQTVFEYFHPERCSPYTRKKCLANKCTPGIKTRQNPRMKQPNINLRVVQSSHVFEGTNYLNLE